MKILGIKIHLAKEWRTFLFVEVFTDEGITGIGEAGLTSRELAVAGALQHLEPVLIGQDPFRTEHLWQTCWRGGFFPGGAVMSSAIAAIDIALWDIKGKALGVPVYELLGGRVRDRVLTYAHLGVTHTEDILRQAHDAVDQGWKCLRFELSSSPDQAFEPRVAIERAAKHWDALRESLGDEVELCFDVHTKLGVADARRLCRAVEPYRPYFMEDPLRSEHPEAYRQLRAHTAVPLAAGEQFAHRWQFRRLVEEGLIDYARLDLCIAGGFTEGRKVMAMCETHGIDMAVHNPIGPVSTAACLQFNLSCPNFLVQELPRRPGECLPEVVTRQPVWEDGYLLPDSAPGLGIEMDFDELKRYPFEMSELPHLHRQDGSFNNW